MMTEVLYLSYNGLLEPILFSQVIPYIKELAKRNFRFTLLTYEKKKDILRTGKDGIKALKAELRSSGIEWRYLRYHKKPATFSTLFDIMLGVLYCAYLIPKKRIKIVHARGITPGSMMLVLSRIFKVKTLFDMRGRLAEEMAAGGLWKEESMTFRLIKICEKNLLKKADAVTVLTKKHFESNKSLDYLKDRRISMDAIPCCVDTAKFYYDEKKAAEFKKRLGLDGKFVLIYPGKTGAFYLMDRMLDFYKVMLDIIPNAVFFILTKDEVGHVLKKAVSVGIKEGMVRFECNVDFDGMPDYLRIADAGIFFINSHNKFGSSPIKMGEFLASGVPVIINPGVGDSEDIVRENGVGVILTDFNEACYKKAVHELLRLKENGEALRKRCSDTAARHLSLADGVDRYYEIYKALS